MTDTVKEIKGKKRTVLEAVVLVSVLVVAVVGLWFLAGYVTKSDAVNPPGSSIRVSLKIKSGEWEIDYLDVTTHNNTVYKLLLEC